MEKTKRTAEQIIADFEAEFGIDRLTYYPHTIQSDCLFPCIESGDEVYIRRYDELKESDLVLIKENGLNKARIITESADNKLVLSTYDNQPETEISETEIIGVIIKLVRTFEYPNYSLEVNPN